MSFKKMFIPSVVALAVGLSMTACANGEKDMSNSEYSELKIGNATLKICKAADSSGLPGKLSLTDLPSADLSGFETLAAKAGLKGIRLDKGLTYARKPITDCDIGAIPNGVEERIFSADGVDSKIGYRVYTQPSGEIWLVKVERLQSLTELVEGLDDQ